MKDACWIALSLSSHNYQINYYHEYSSRLKVNLVYVIIVDLHFPLYTFFLHKIIKASMKRTISFQVQSNNRQSYSNSLNG